MELSPTPYTYIHKQSNKYPLSPKETILSTCHYIVFFLISISDKIIIIYYIKESRNNIIEEIVATWQHTDIEGFSIGYVRDTQKFITNFF
jgi:hypothetical protein